jgi:hypothetical protein
MALNVISQPIGVVVELRTIIKIRKYKGLHERHHFISMAMEVDNTPRRDMDNFIRECTHLFHDRQLKDHLFLSFCIQFFRQHVSISFQHTLAFTIERKIALTGDVLF